MKRQVPPATASPEKKREAQKKRATKFGIEALEGKGEDLSFPKGDPTVLRLYGDPVNLNFPLGRANNKLDVKRANNARTRFKQFANRKYSKTKSKRIVHNRIVEAQLKGGASPGFDENDALDKLLSSTLKKKLKRMTERSAKYNVTFQIVERKARERLITGIVADPENVDSYLNRISDEEIEQAAISFAEDYQNFGTDHQKDSKGQPIVNPKIKLIFNEITRVVQDIGNRKKVPVGAWVVTVRVDKETDKRVERGELNGFSFEAKARREPIAA